MQPYSYTYSSRRYDAGGAGTIDLGTLDKPGREEQHNVNEHAGEAAGVG